jgi:hypothetical protein
MSIWSLGIRGLKSLRQPPVTKTRSLPAVNWAGYEDTKEQGGGGLNAESLPACGGADRPEVGKRRPGLDWVIAWRLQKVSTWKFVVFFMALWYQMLYSSKNCAPQFLNENLIGGFAGVLDS